MTVSTLHWSLQWWRSSPTTNASSPAIFTAGAGHVARFFIGRTKGYYNPRLSVEDVRTHLDEIRDETDYTVPAGPAEEMSELFKAVMAQ